MHLFSMHSKSYFVGPCQLLKACSLNNKVKDTLKREGTNVHACFQHNHNGSKIFRCSSSSYDGRGFFCGSLRRLYHVLRGKLESKKEIVTSCFLHDIKNKFLNLPKTIHSNLEMQAFVLSKWATLKQSLQA